MQPLSCSAGSADTLACYTDPTALRSMCLNGKSGAKDFVSQSHNRTQGSGY